MPPGLDGYWWETEHMVCVPLVQARQRGVFLPWLMALERKGKPVFFPSVINARLQRLLALRGYVGARVETDMGWVSGFAKLPGWKP